MEALKGGSKIVYELRSQLEYVPNNPYSVVRSIFSMQARNAVLSRPNAMLQLCFRSTAVVILLVLRDLVFAQMTA